MPVILLTVKSITYEVFLQAFIRNVIIRRGVLSLVDKMLSQSRAKFHGLTRI